MKQIELNLVEDEARLILEALAELDAKWQAICESSNDEDEVAEYGNDLVELRLLAEKLQAVAVSAFGKGVLNFDRRAL